MQNPIDEEFENLFNDSKEIIDKINKLLENYKNIDDYLKFGFVDETFRSLLETNENKCNELGEKIKANTQKFVIFGETNAGKSTFINAMIFQSEILPTGCDATTKCFIEIKQSVNNRNYLVVDNQEKPFSELENIVKSENNRARHVNLFFNFLKSDCFANNIIIETPGTDFDEEYGEKSLQYCNEADIVILVVNATNCIGKSMETFCKKFKKNLSKLNLYVVFNHCDLLQQSDDWQNIIDEKIQILTKLFPTTSRKKMALISSYERMIKITNTQFIFQDETSRIRNISFKNLSEQIINERYQISNLCRCGCLLKILEIMNNNTKCFSKIMTEESAFFDVDFEVVSSFKHEIAEIVLSFSQNFIELACQLNTSINWSYENHSKYIWGQFFKPKAGCKEKSQYQYENLGNCDDVNFSESEKNSIGKLLKTMENNIKEKVKTEIINYLEINGGNDKDKLLFVMKNIYFRKIIDEIDFLGYEKVLTCINRKKSQMVMRVSGTCALVLGSAFAATAACLLLLPVESAVSTVVGVGFGMYYATAIGLGIVAGLGTIVVDKIANIPLEKFALNEFLEKCSDELFNSFMNFQIELRKYSDLPNKKQQIRKVIIVFKRKIDSLQNKYSVNEIKDQNCYQIAIRSNRYHKTDSFLQNIDKRFSEETLKSLIEKYDNVNDLEESPINECLEIINNYNLHYLSIINDCLNRNLPLNEHLKFSLNCLYVSFNVISKYIEKHRPRINLNDSCLISVFEGFVDKISSNHLAERICESILYAMCSLMKLDEMNIDNKFWILTLKSCIQNDKISEENKLASYVILAQLAISERDSILKIAEYLFNKIDIDCDQDYFGFTKSEIIDARLNALKKLTNLSKTILNNDFDPNLLMIDIKKLIDVTASLNSNQIYINEMNDISMIVFDSFENQYSKLKNEQLMNKNEKLSPNNSNDLIESYLKLFVNESHLTIKIVEHILSFLHSELRNQTIERNDNLSNILLKLFRDCKSSENIKLSSALLICDTIDRDKTPVIEILKYLNEIIGTNGDNYYGVSVKKIKLAINLLYDFGKK